MKQIVIPIEGMSCGSCANRIKKTLAAIDGVSGIDVSVADKRAVTFYDPSKLAPTRLTAAIDGLGFKAGAPTEVAP